MDYNFVFEGKEFTLNEEKFLEFINDEEQPVEGINLEKILTLLNENKNNIEFEKSYYDEPCDKCNFGSKDDKFFPFLEYQFYINTKKNKYVTSNISKENDENISFNKMKKAGKVDSSYIVFLEVCENCGEFFIVIEKVEE